jgi:prepilin-type processing-associated H-X9-DG protein
VLTRFRKPALTAALLAGLLALPACKKKDDGPDPTGLGLRSSDTRALRLGQNYLKQIGLAFHNFHDSTGQLPAGFYGPDGKVGLSWRVAILPYIEHDNLFRQFKLNEPWDSEHNKKLIPQMPKIYGPPDNEIDTNGHTYLRAFAGNGALMPLPGPEFKGQAGQMVRGPRIFDITDGTSNTLMVVEAGEAVVWTKPDELEFKPSGPLPKLGGVFRDGMNVLFCDGSVRFLEADIPAAKLKALITTNGGEAFALDD